MSMWSEQNRPSLSAKLQYKAEMSIADFSLNFVCPTCGAPPQEKCKSRGGTRGLESHIERWKIAYGYQRSAAFRRDGPLCIWMKKGLQILNQRNI
jgi:hypothetical protein